MKYAGGTEYRMDLVNKFMTLDEKESRFEKVDMPGMTVFYPFFHFKAAEPKFKGYGKPIEEGTKACKIRVHLDGSDPGIIKALERSLYPDRPEAYGFWTAKKEDSYYIGLGAANLLEFMKDPAFEGACLVLLKGMDAVYVLGIGMENGSLSGVLDIYLSDCQRPFAECLKDVKDVLDASGIKTSGDLKGESVHYSFRKYAYAPEEQMHVNFRDNVQGCTWHTTVFNDNLINEGPHYVLVKNPGIKLGNILDDLSSWLVHRRGGFVMGREFECDDFHQDTTFTLREVDEYRMGDLLILNIECDTYTKNRDESFESFLKGLSEKRFIRL
ncbi:MAG: hypothetical protein JW724_01420 [Candidatus Altiarchaeota archaeon]|nr:hypothetical protein [Candidatus Altiarchaeota archaeon]